MRLKPALLALRPCRTIAVAAAAGLLFGCLEQEEAWPPPLFDCKGDDGRYLLRSLEDGELVLEIEGPPKGNLGVSTWLVTWHEVRTGYVIGQQGGNQSHVRLFDGQRHFVLYEGENGALSDTLGETYAGVAVAGATPNAEPVAVASCEATATNRALLENVRKTREAAGAPPLDDEDAGGPFDVWF